MEGAEIEGSRDARASLHCCAKFMVRRRRGAQVDGGRDDDVWCLRCFREKRGEVFHALALSYSAGVHGLHISSYKNRRHTDFKISLFLCSC
jgi:hypothetical protein